MRGGKKSIFFKIVYGQFVVVLGSRDFFFFGRPVRGGKIFFFFLIAYIGGWQFVVVLGSRDFYFPR